MKQLAVIFTIILTVAAFARAAEPERADGLSVHMLPKSVAEISGEKAGFTILQQSGKSAPKVRETIETAEALVEHFKKLSPKIQQNGIWVVTTHPDAYSDAESKKLEKLKEICAKDHIPLFTCRGSELPKGWKRQDK